SDDQLLGSDHSAVHLTADIDLAPGYRGFDCCGLGHIDIAGGLDLTFERSAHAQVAFDVQLTDQSVARPEHDHAGLCRSCRALGRVLVGRLSGLSCSKTAESFPSGRGRWGWRRPRSEAS